MTSPQTAPPPTTPPATLWVLTDDVVGHANQSLGVAESLGLPFETRVLRYRGLALLPGTLGPRSLVGLAPASRAALTPPWPGLVIATGRRLASVARWIKQRAGAEGHRTILVQIMDPGRGYDDFDLIAAPRHDGMGQRANVIETIGAPNRITAARLAVEGARWRDRLAALPSPRIAVLVGGATRRRGFAPDLAMELGRLASALAKARGGSLMITTSRRTGAAAADALAGAVSVPFYMHRWGSVPAGAAEANPYFGFLGLCDEAIVTGESVSMCSEACAAGKPVHIYAPAAIIKPAFARLHETLYQAGMARPLGPDSAADVTQLSYVPLSAAAQVATEIRRRLLIGA